MSDIPAMSRYKIVHLRGRVYQAACRKRAQIAKAIAKAKQTETTLPRPDGLTYVPHVTGLSRREAREFAKRDPADDLVEGKPKFDVLEINRWLEARRIAGKTARV